MKKIIAVVLVLVLGIFALRFFFGSGGPVQMVSVPTTNRAAAAISNAFATASPQANAAIEKSFAGVNATTGSVLSAASAPAAPRVAGIAQPVEITRMEPLAVLENARTAIHNYGQRFDGNPVGSNEEITRALMGENPKQVNFISADAGLRVNGQGELMDAWGVPFFFHQLSGTQMEIRSAGPDKLFWTLDDLVTR